MGMKTLWIWIVSIFESIEKARLAAELTDAGLHDEARKIFD
jgi:hypothetical protein